ncbi:MAG: 2,3-dihydroxy-p-cumate-3,4-dioxygenase [Betaproteobacteria bacterium]|nr:2,3-dihydroxy-p-cumate-3,4-dioxygenase [Betaproteobacteria bacterium]
MGGQMNVPQMNVPQMNVPQMNVPQMNVPYRHQGLGYVHLNVSNVARSVAFYQSVVGLALVEHQANGSAVFQAGGDHHSVILSRADKPGLKRIGWRLESERDVGLAHDYLDALGLKPIEVDAGECASLGQGRTIRIREPNTAVEFEYFGTVTRRTPEFKPTLTKIVRIGHVVLRVGNFTESVETLTTKLGFRTSDIVRDRAVFLRCHPNPLHHSLAVIRNTVSGLHHVNFMVTDVDDIGKAVNRLKANDVPIVFGPGRHPPSDSIFLYFLDPDRMTMEFSFGMECFPEFDARAPRVMDPVPISIDAWGGLPRPGYAATGEFEMPETIES